MNGTGYMDIDARKQHFTVLKKNDTYVGQAALDNRNNERLLAELIEM